MKIFIDDHDDGDDDDDDDDDVVERTRTGPSTVRSDLERQVNHNSKITQSLPRFQLKRRRRANRRGQDEVFGRMVTMEMAHLQMIYHDLPLKNGHVP